ncbi:pilus assembly protein TadG-related protein [[Micrococcus luteus] ATCC 49442]|uniref:pilus assembly protein TadG-related protein n=1 Tax=[Micrococcus luteus] ATCC 49442 TaxID=2698727 RepID=UPI003D662ED3
MHTVRAAEPAEPEEDRERGATAVVVAFALVALLGFAALAVDVGAMYAEKAQLQTGADATALAIAGDCAKGIDCSVAMATEGNLLAGDNTTDGSAGVFSVTQPNTNTVRVETNSQAAGSTEDSFELFFARVLGNENAVIHAVAEATWGTPTKATTLPWTVSECVFQSVLTPTQLHSLNTTGSFEGYPTDTHILLRYDENTPTYPGCAAQNGYRPGGFGWLETNTDCSTDIDLSATVDGQPGNHFPNDAGKVKACDALKDTIMDEPALIPLFDSNTGNGDNTVYSLIGFAAFQVTGFKFSGSIEHFDPEAPKCLDDKDKVDKNCRFLQGYFTRFVSLEEGMSLSTGANHGGSAVRLSK